MDLDLPEPIRPTGTSRRAEPPRFDEIPPAPDTPMGQIVGPSLLLRSLGVRRAQRLFRVFLIVAIIALIASAFL